MATISLKTILLIHWFLIMWSALSQLGPGYLWVNFTVLGIGLWAVADRQSVDALFMFICTMLASVIFDIVFLALYFPLAYNLAGSVASTFKFAAAMYIINLIFKPVSILLSYKMYCDRGGNINLQLGGPGDAPPYDQIGEDRSGGFNSGGLGGSSAHVPNAFPQAGQAYQQAPPNPQKTDLLTG